MAGAHREVGHFFSSPLGHRSLLAVAAPLLLLSLRVDDPPVELRCGFYDFGLECTDCSVYREDRPAARCSSLYSSTIRLNVLRWIPSSLAARD